MNNNKKLNRAEVAQAMEEYCVKMDKISRKPWGKLL